METVIHCFFFFYKYLFYKYFYSPVMQNNLFIIIIICFSLIFSFGTIVAYLSKQWTDRHPNDWMAQSLCFSPQCIIGLLNFLCLFVVNGLKPADWLFKSTERPIRWEVRPARLMTSEWDMSDHEPYTFMRHINVVSQDVFHAILVSSSLHMTATC